MAPPRTAPGTKPPYAHTHTCTYPALCCTRTHTPCTLTPPSTSPPCYLQWPLPCHPGWLAAPTAHMLPHALHFLAVPSVAFPQPTFSPLPCIDLLTHPSPDLSSHSSRSGLTFPFTSRTLIALPRKATTYFALPLNPSLALHDLAHPSSTWNSRPLFNDISWPCPALSAPPRNRKALRHLRCFRIMRGRPGEDPCYHTHLYGQPLFGSNPCMS